MTLFNVSLALIPTFAPPLSLIEVTYLERQPSLHLIRQYLRNTAIEVRQNLHRKLRFDATLADEVVKGVRQSHADAK